MKTILFALAIVFSSSVSILYSQTVSNKEKEFPAEFEVKWYYQFIERLNLTPQNFSEFGYFYINGTLVSEEEKTGEFEVYYSASDVLYTGECLINSEL